jgi:hypothetical protein
VSIEPLANNSYVGAIIAEPAFPESIDDMIFPLVKREYLFGENAAKVDGYLGR